MLFYLMKNPVSYILTSLTRPLAQWQLKVLTKHCENSSSDHPIYHIQKTILILESNYLKI